MLSASFWHGEFLLSVCHSGLARGAHEVGVDDICGFEKGPGHIALITDSKANILYRELAGQYGYNY